MRFDLIMITTCCNHQYIYELIETSRFFNKSIKTCVIIVNQSANKINDVIKTINTEYIIIEHNQLENTSVGRNIGIDYLINFKLTSHFVYFPDDDSSFDAGFFDGIKIQIQKGKFQNFITDVYCTGTRNLFRKINLPNHSRLNKYNFNIVGAVNTIVNFATFSKVHFFDERFGVNAKYGAGEDGDYFIRGIGFQEFYYTNEIYSYHPSGDSKYEKLTYGQVRKRLRGYAKGGIALLCKHKMFTQATILALRALGGVMKYLLKLNFLLAIAYFEAFFVRMWFFFKFRVLGVK